MLTHQLFLGHNDQCRLQFYQQYVDLPHDYQNADSAARLRHVSTTSIYRAMQVIADDLNQLRAEKGLATMPASIPINKRFNIPAPGYAVFLMRESLAGKFLLAVLQHPDWSLREFADSQNTSNATIFRRVRNLSEFLKQFDVRINFNPIGLIGNETVIRFTLAELIWQLSQDGTDLLPELAQEANQVAQAIEDAGLKTSNFVRARLNIICAVNIARQRQGHVISGIRPIEEILSTTVANPRHKHLTSCPVNFESSFALIYLEMMLGTSFHSHKDELAASFIGHHARLNTIEWQFVNLIVRRVRSVAGVDEHRLDDQVLIGNMLIITVALNLLDVPVPAFEPVMVATGTPTPNSLKKAVNQIFATLPDHLQSFRRIQTSLTTRLLPLLSSAMPDAMEKVRIHIDPTMEHQIYVAVEASLQQMPAVKLVQSDELARLTITSDLSKAYLPMKEDSHYFYFSISSYSAWLRLEHYIHYLAVHEFGIRTGSGIDYTYTNLDFWEKVKQN